MCIRYGKEGETASYFYPEDFTQRAQRYKEHKERREKVVIVSKLGLTISR